MYVTIVLNDLSGFAISTLTRCEKRGEQHKDKKQQYETRSVFNGVVVSLRAVCAQFVDKI